ncbi:MAG: helix-turn-helix transcriptional regulator [Acidobacteriota bacterium]
MSREPTRLEDHLPVLQAALNILLALLEGEAHGHGIKKSIEDRTSGRLKMRAGTLYGALHRLDHDGLIDEVQTPSDCQEATSRWRYYASPPWGAPCSRPGYGWKGRF